MPLPPPSSGPSQPITDISNRKHYRGVDPSTGLPLIQLDKFGGGNRRRMGMQYPQPMGGGSNAGGFTPGRGLSVGEIMSQREGRSNAYYTGTGQPVPRGTPLMASGWNTSGVGPGTAGYRGSYRQGGYNYGQGTLRPGATSAAEYYRNRGSSLDRFANNANSRSMMGPPMLDGARQYGGPVRRGGRYLVGEEGPEVVVMPQEGYVVPNPRSRRAPSFRNADEYYAYRDQTVGNPLDRGARKWGSPTVRDVGPYPMAAANFVGDNVANAGQWYDEGLFSQSALDQVEGKTAPYDGEVREGGDGRMWRYDATLGRGVPVNVYEGDNLHAPSPPVELMDPQERFNDLRMRLEALKAEAGRNFQDRRRFDEAQFVQPPVQGLTGGPTPTGREISGRYGRGSVSTAPVEKSFTVDRTDGTRGRYNNLADATTESRAEAATRRLRSRRY